MRAPMSTTRRGAGERQSQSRLDSELLRLRVGCLARSCCVGVSVVVSGGMGVFLGGGGLCTGGGETEAEGGGQGGRGIEEGAKGGSDAGVAEEAGGDHGVLVLSL